MGIVFIGKQQVNQKLACVVLLVKKLREDGKEAGRGAKRETDLTFVAERMKYVWIFLRNRGGISYTHPGYNRFWMSQVRKSTFPNKKINGSGTEGRIYCWVVQCETTDIFVRT